MSVTGPTHVLGLHCSWREKKATQISGLLCELVIGNMVPSSWAVLWLCQEAPILWVGGQTTPGLQVGGDDCETHGLLHSKPQMLLQARTQEGK